MAAFTSGTTHTVQVPQPMPVSQGHITHDTTTTVVTDKQVDNRHTYDRHDPADEWSSRDLLLSIMPFLIAVAFRNAALHAGLIVALSLSVYLLFKRHAFWNGFAKRMWPVLDITSVILFAIMLGCSWKVYADGTNVIEKWLIVIISATFAIVALISLAVRRPFTSHYAHFAHFDNGGHGLWNADAQWRAVNDKSTIVWAFFWTVACLLSLAPTLGYNDSWYGRHGLNVVFNYIVPLGGAALALIATQTLGRKYSHEALPISSTAVNRV